MNIDVQSGVLSSVVIFLAALVFVGCLLAFPIMWLWNWLMPVIFGLPTIGAWQALGLYLLFGFLFRTSSSS